MGLFHEGLLHINIIVVHVEFHVEKLYAFATLQPLRLSGCSAKHSFARKEGLVDAIGLFCPPPKQADYCVGSLKPVVATPS